jgi:hypothetical protein
MDTIVLWLTESAAGLWLTTLTLTIVALSMAIGFLIEMLWWRGPLRTLAFIITITLMVGLALLLPLGRWTALGYVFAILVTTYFVQAGRLLCKAWRRRQVDQHADPANWGVL